MTTADTTVDSVADAELTTQHCLEPVDHVAGDAQTTAFKRRARLQQAHWRGDRPIGHQPIRPCPGERRELGSRLQVDYAFSSKANFLSDNIRQAVRDRLDNPQRHQTLNTDRLHCDLLSSMPMCFNLFGELWADLALADRAVHAWWLDVPGRVSAVRFEWSPGRCVPGKYLENRSAFDVAFELELPGGQRGVLGVETKYHEHCKAEAVPRPHRLARYELVAEKVNIMSTETMQRRVLGTDLQQIWLDHLLALSMKQPLGEWKYVRFVLVHPERNPSYAKAAERYASLLTDASTFGVCTIESLLRKKVLPEPTATAFEQRYLWQDFLT